MPSFRSRRLAAVLSVTAIGVGAGVVAAPAQAQLGGLLPNLGTIVTETGQTLGNLVPGVGGVVTGVTGTVGGVVGGVQDTVTSTVDQTLGGVLDGALGGEGGGLLPDNVLNDLIGTLLGNSSAAPGTPGTGGPNAGGPIVFSGGQVGPGGVIIDASAPRPTVTVLSKLKAIGKDGRMRLQIKVDEPGIVALTGKVRPGAAVKTRKGATKAKHSRKLIKVPTIVLGYRKAGKLVVTVKLSREAQRALGKSKDAKMSIGTVAADLFKNQGSENAKVKIKR